MAEPTKVEAVDTPSAEVGTVAAVLAPAILPAVDKPAAAVSAATACAVAVSVEAVL